MFNIFQQPWTLIVTAIICLLIVLVFRALFVDKKRLWQLALPFVIVALAISLDLIVKTDYEKINSALNGAIDSFEAKRIDSIEQVLADDYTDAANSSKTLILAYFEGLFQIAPVRKISIMSKKIAIEESRAVFTAEVVVHFADESEFAKMGKSLMLIKGRFFLRKTDDKKWLIYSSELLELDRKSITWPQIK